MDKRVRELLNQIAAEQRGLFSVSQARSVGASHPQLQRALSSGTLRRVRRGVYAIKGTAPSRWEEMIAAALVAGPGAVVSHQSAAAVHRFEYASPGPVELTLAAKQYARPAGTIVHRSANLTPDDVVMKRGILVTSACRTLVDLAARLGPELTEKTVDEGLIQRRWSVLELEDCLARARTNLAGRACLERILALRSASPSADSALEARVYRALTPFLPYQAHFSTVAQGSVYVLDAAWPDRMVAIEIVGRSHRVASRSAFDRERRKFNALSASGWTLGHLISTMSEREILAVVRSLFESSGVAATAGPRPAIG